MGQGSTVEFEAQFVLSGCGRNYYRLYSKLLLLSLSIKINRLKIILMLSYRVIGLIV